MWNILACMIQYLLSVDIIWNMIHIIWNGEKETTCGRIFDKISFWIKSLILDRLFFGGETSCTIIWQSKFLDKITCFGQIFLLLLWDALYKPRQTFCWVCCAESSSSAALRLPCSPGPVFCWEFRCFNWIMSGLVFVLVICWAEGGFRWRVLVVDTRTIVNNVHPSLNL